MITHKSNKITEKQYPYLNMVLMVILIAGFAVLALFGAQTVDNATMDAESPVVVADPVDLTGEWVGTGTEDYGVESRYDLRLTLAQEGEDVYGIQFMVTSNYEPEIYASSTITGTFDGETFSYVENEVIELYNIPLDYWCLAGVELSYEKVGDQDTLIGTWGSGEPDRAECQGIEGRVLLTRQAD